MIKNLGIIFLRSVFAATLLIGLGGCLGGYMAQAGSISKAAVPKSVLASHVALYKVSLDHAESQSDLVSVRGAMRYKIDQECEGWVTESSVYMMFSYAQGQDMGTTWTFASWEAKDGLSYRFRLRQTQNGEEIEVLQGSASRPELGAPGEALFNIPKGVVLALPEGFLFPTEHLLMTMAEANSGGVHFNKIVFDGASLDNPYEISALISNNKRSAGPDEGQISEGLRRIRMSFHLVDSQASLPEFELEGDYRPDGIADYILQDFGEFTLKLLPQTIDIVDAPVC